ncbi:MAG: hypothetical protein VX089_00490, partial [Pseudomonadota bacterium]|nr:hypothetical protein [Pseudomonadota bacterium]
MFKNKIIKYFLISALILFFLIFIAILRLSYKPLDVTYFSNVYPLIQKKVSESYDFKSKKIFLELNVLKNEIYLKVDNIFLQNFSYKIYNVKAKQVLFTFKITDIIKNKIEANNITITQGGLDIHDLKEFIKANQFDNPEKTNTFNNIVFEEININIYESNNKVAVLSNINLDLSKSKDGIHINNLLIDNIALRHFNKKNNLILNNLKLIQENKPSYTFKVENIEFQNKGFAFQTKYLKRINNFFLKDIIFNYDSISFLASIRGQVFLNNYTNNFFINGNIKNYREFNGDVTVNVDKFPALTLLKNDILIEKKYEINNISSVLLSGKLLMAIKENSLKKVAVNIFSKLNEKDTYLRNLNNSSKIKIEDIRLEGQINHNI